MSLRIKTEVFSSAFDRTLYIVNRVRACATKLNYSFNCTRYVFLLSNAEIIQFKPITQNVIQFDTSAEKYVTISITSAGMYVEKWLWIQIVAVATQIVER